MATGYRLGPISFDVVVANGIPDGTPKGRRTLGRGLTYLALQCGPTVLRVLPEAAEHSGCYCEWCYRSAEAKHAGA